MEICMPHESEFRLRPGIYNRDYDVPAKQQLMLFLFLWSFSGGCHAHLFVAFFSSSAAFFRNSELTNMHRFMAFKGALCCPSLTYVFCVAPVRACMGWGESGSWRESVLMIDAFAKKETHKHKAT